MVELSLFSYALDFTGVKYSLDDNFGFSHKFEIAEFN